MDMGPLTPGSACQKKVHASGPTQQQKKAFILEVCARGQGSRVKVKAPTRRAPGQKAEAEESIQRGGPDVVLDSAVTDGEGQRSR